MARLKDIADQLGVSVSTVSRVVNNKDRVDPDTRKRIQNTLRRMNYQPDENARRLKTRTSNVLGVIVPDISNPFYASVIKGIERVSARSGYSVIVCNTDENREREKKAVQLLARQKVAGLIAATTFDDAQVRGHYGAHPAPPAVFFDNIPTPGVQRNCVTIDNVLAARELTGYMIGRGHRRICMISGPRGEYSADGRVKGWREALGQAGIEPEEGWLGYGDFREESGWIIMERMLREEKPTAVCAANNLMAYGAIKRAMAEGLSIPDDISLGAFDVVDPSGLMKPRVTAVVQPAEEIGAAAADMCIAAGASPGPSRRILLGHRLLENETVREIPLPFGR